MNKLRCAIFAGPNGSGKSTLIREMLSNLVYNIPHRYINADDIARDMTTGMQLEKEKSAFRQARQLREVYRLQGLSFSFETVFSHPSTLLDLIKLRDAGYHVTFAFVATQDVEINVTRVRKRVLSGGHDVPLDKIRSRYERAFAFLPLAAEIADRTIVWDNTYELTAVCEINGGQITKTQDCTPFYEARFVTPFNARRDERNALRVRFPRLQMPEIQSGVYEGRVTELGKHYAVQEANGVPTLHDRTLLTGDIAPNETVQIAYRDGYAAPVQNFP